MSWYPFQDYEEKYIFMDCYNLIDRDPLGFFVIVATVKNPEKRLTFCFSNYLHSWRVLKGPAASVYKNRLKKCRPIATKQQFSVYDDSPYITLFCRYSSEIPDNLQHICFDLDTVIIETISKLDGYFVLCLGDCVI